MRGMTPNKDEDGLVMGSKNGKKIPIKTSKDVLKHRKSLGGAPSDVQVAAAWVLMTETDWPKILGEFVDDVVQEREGSKAMKDVNRTLNFVTRALYSKMCDMHDEQVKHRNN